MDEHMRVGHEFRTIVNHTTYSFGIDDQEFMTAFECDEPADFMHLMLTLRESEASRYTERDTPIFVGRHVEIRAALDALDGGPASRLSTRSCAGRARRGTSRSLRAQHEQEREGVEPGCPSKKNTSSAATMSTPPP